MSFRQKSYLGRMCHRAKWFLQGILALEGAGGLRGFTDKMIKGLAARMTGDSEDEQHYRIPLHKGHQNETLLSGKCQFSFMHGASLCKTGNLNRAQGLINLTNRGWKWWRELGWGRNTLLGPSASEVKQRLRSWPWRSLRVVYSSEACRRTSPSDAARGAAASDRRKAR